MLTLAELAARHAQSGRVTWLGVRPARSEPVVPVVVAEIGPAGLVGDRRTRPGLRAVTLIQAEHLAAIAALSGHDTVDPAILRRNVVVAELNLLALRGATFRLGTALLRGTGPCAPCSRMEAALGPGGYNAMRGHGGLTAEVIEPGRVALGDSVTPLAAAP
jgi:MOSC domain-containing protein YiiM